MRGCQFRHPDISPEPLDPGGRAARGYTVMIVAGECRTRIARFRVRRGGIRTRSMHRSTRRAPLRSIPALRPAKMVSERGVEPPRPFGHTLLRRARLSSYATRTKLERGTGIEPVSTAWKAVVLPLNEPRGHPPSCASSHHPPGIALSRYKAERDES
jgi:hypothetical protein